MNLLRHFKDELKKLGVPDNAWLLIAVSGGVDSMVLFHLARSSGYNCEVAHANFNLRSAESQGDETLVREACEDLKIPFHSRQFNIDKTDMPDGLQAKARELRYRWFNEIMDAGNFDFLLTAHHLNDQVETLFMNLLRASGIKGLKSMQPKSGRVLRPLLKVEKTDILAFAEAEGVKWRDDSSNASDDYLRNRVRHHIIPAFAEIDNSALTNAGVSMEHIAEADAFFKREAEEAIRNFRVDGELIGVSDADWADLFRRKPLHKYVLESWGFLPDQLEHLEALPKSQSGKVIAGPTHRAVRDRGEILIHPLPREADKSIALAEKSGEIDAPIGLSWDRIDLVPNTDLRDSRLAFVDADRITFPLRLRKWRTGDRFTPFGMKGSKKLSDFFTDLKLSLPEKENQFVLCNSDGRIIWIVGRRIDGDFAIGEGSENIIRFKFLDA